MRQQTRNTMHHIREVTVRYGPKPKTAEAIKGPQDIAKLVRKIIKENGKEHFIMFCLDGGNYVISYNIVTKGIANSTPVHPREVFQLAIATGAVSIVVAHNHPSGSLEASRPDIDTTTRLVDAGNLLGISVLDHIIVTDRDFSSLRETGAL